MKKGFLAIKDREHARFTVKAFLVMSLIVGTLAGIMFAGSWILDRWLSSRIRASVVLVVVDTLRADRMGFMGDDRGLTPELDRIAAGSTVFEDAWSHAPWTLPAFASLFTSRTPGHHGAGGRMDGFRSLHTDAVTVAEVFRNHGARTHAVVNVLFLGDKFGLAQGFDTVDASYGHDNRGDRTAAETTDAALAWLDDNGDEPFFLLVHYFDPHLVYDPPEPFRSRHSDVSEGHVFGTGREMVGLREGRRTIDEQTVRKLSGLYDGEVAYTDREIGRLVRGIDEREMRDRVVLVVTADHGEELMDHGGFEHGHTLFSELLHVPLLVRVPALLEDLLAPGKRVGTRVGLVDVAPTLCELASIPASKSFDGKSLLYAIDAPDRDVIARGNMWGPSGWTLLSGKWKVIVEPEGGPTRLYDIDADPGEHDDLAAAEPDVVKDMVTTGEQSLGHVTDSPAPELSERELEMLRSLGYMQ